jgi:hypothetical protein
MPSEGNPSTEDGEAKFNETLKRMLNSPPAPHKESARPKPSAPRLRPAKPPPPPRLGEEGLHDGSEPVKHRRKAK